MAKRSHSLDDRQWRRFRDKLEKAKGAKVKVGVIGAQAAATHPGGISMVGLAAIHEYGAPRAGIPERSFIRRTFDTRRDDVKRLSERLAKGFVLGKLSLHKALDILGAQGVAWVKHTITSGKGVPPPLKAETIRRKGSDRPLVDTGRLLGAITHEVINAGSTGRGGFRK